MDLTRNDLQREIGATIEERIAWYHRWQETQPVRYRPEYKLWEVFGYHDVQRVLTDHAAFSIHGMLPADFPGALGKADPPDHRRLRNLASKGFTPRRVEQLAPRISSLIDKLLEPAIADGSMEVVTQLTAPLPIGVVAQMLGLPPEDEERFKMWSYQLLGQMVGAWDADNRELIQYFSDLLQARKESPRDDLMSAFVAAEDDGSHLTRDEIVSLCLELLMAGNVTTTMLITRALNRCCTQPEIFEELRAEPKLIPSAIEEFLRYEFSSISLLRTARVDTILGGQEIKAGQLVVAWPSAANFDETMFPQSQQFDIRRSPNPHLTFGYGLHFCLGAPLARLEGRIAFERLTEHFSAVRMDPARPPVYMNGLEELIQSLYVLMTPMHALKA